MFKTLFATALLSFSVGAKSLDHRESSTPQATYVNGSFNLKNSFDFDTDEFDYASYDILFEDIDYNKAYLNPFTFYDASVSFYYLYQINFNTNTPSVLSLTFYYYDNDNATNSFSFVIGDGDNITNLDDDYSDLIINFRTTYILSGDEAKLFNICFTQEDNLYVRTYNGYYSFTSDPTTINNSFFLTGAIAFNNQIYSVFGNKDDGTWGPHNYMVFAQYYDITTESYQLYYYDLPFARSNVISLNVLMSNVKLSNTSYQTLNSIGIFAYQHDPTYDDSDWKDLLFSVMDSPIYMISRLLNFQLFGINLYIALAGLLTIVVIVFCVRKFM